ncbi:MAG TPA: response regulator [Alphaproteobacteria bacterium]
MTDVSCAVPAHNGSAPPQIVVVDDDAMLSWTVAAELAEAGYQPTVFDSGRAVLQYFAAGGSAAAVLLDWQMRGLGGADVLREFRTRGYTAPVIVLSADVGFKDAALAEGAVDFVQKANGFTIVLAHLQRVLGQGARRHVH